MFRLLFNNNEPEDRTVKIVQNHFGQIVGNTIDINRINTTINDVETLSKGLSGIKEGQSIDFYSVQQRDFVTITRKGGKLEIEIG